MIVTDKRMSF